MRLLVACPVVQPPADVPGYRTWDRPVLLVDNTARAAWLRTADEHGWPYLTVGANLGVAASWNLAHAYARGLDDPPDYLALISSSVVWNAGLSQLDRLVAACADHRGLLTDHAFHAAVWSLELLAALGPFDENFWPGYYEDNDWVWRLHCAGLHTGSDPIPKVEIDASCDNAKTLLSGAIAQPDFGLLLRYFSAKWGGPPTREAWCSPFSLPVPGGWWPVLHSLCRWSGRPLAVRAGSLGNSRIHRATEGER